MTDVLSLIKSLRLKGGNKGFQKALFLCAKELFGLSNEEFEKRWRPRISSDKGTLRQYMQPTAESLFQEWKEKRDPEWLYSHPEYKWDSIGVSYCQTQATTTGGVKLLKNAGAKPKRIFDWGAGPGFSTIILARNFPDAEVHYNECNEDLIAVFQWFAKHAGIKNVKHVSESQGDYDLIQAYEIVEHIKHENRPAVGDPITATMKLLGSMKEGSHFLHSSCWTAENNFFTLGHFLRYDVDGEVVGNSAVGKKFRRALASRGWTELGKGWNARPFLFKKVEPDIKR